MVPIYVFLELRSLDLAHFHKGNCMSRSPAGIRDHTEHKEIWGSRGRYLKNEPSTYHCTEKARRDVDQEERHLKNEGLTIAMDLLVAADQLSPWIHTLCARVCRQRLPPMNRVWIFGRRQVAAPRASREASSERSRGVGTSRARYFSYNFPDLRKQ